MSMQDTLERLRRVREAKGKEPVKTADKPENQKKNSLEVTCKTSNTGKTLQSPGAVKIRSDLLGEDIWLVFGDFQTDDGLVCYFPEEIEYLKGLPPEEVKRIHKVKKVFPHGRIVS